MGPEIGDRRRDPRQVERLGPVGLDLALERLETERHRFEIDTVGVEAVQDPVESSVDGGQIGPVLVDPLAERVEGLGGHRGPGLGRVALLGELGLDHRERRMQRVEVDRFRSGQCIDAFGESGEASHHRVEVDRRRSVRGDRRRQRAEVLVHAVEVGPGSVDALTDGIDGGQECFARRPVGVDASCEEGAELVDGGMDRREVHRGRRRDGGDPLTELVEGAAGRPRGGVGVVGLPAERVDDLAEQLVDRIEVDGLGGGELVDATVQGGDGAGDRG